jgi:hypothetical protein
MNIAVLRPLFKIDQLCRDYVALRKAECSIVLPSRAERHITYYATEERKRRACLTGNPPPPRREQQ